jgi:hypothetical protein
VTAWLPPQITCPDTGKSIDAQTAINRTRHNPYLGLPDQMITQSGFADMRSQYDAQQQSLQQALLAYVRNPNGQTACQLVSIGDATNSLGDKARYATCGGSSVYLPNIASWAYSRSGTPATDQAGRMDSGVYAAWSENQEQLRALMGAYAKDPSQENACRIANSQAWWDMWQIVNVGSMVRIVTNGLGRVKPPADLQGQYDDYMRQFNALLDGGLSIDEIPQFEALYQQFAQSPLYTALYGQPSASGGRPNAGAPGQLVTYHDSGIVRTQQEAEAAVNSIINPIRQVGGGAAGSVRQVH